MSEAVEYGYIGLNGSWVDPDTARENKRREAVAEKQRAAAEAELEAERAEQADRGTFPTERHRSRSVR
jgi:hypothetical protein